MHNLLQIAILLYFLCQVTAFHSTRLLRKSKISRPRSMRRQAFLLADGLDSETLGALGDIRELNEALDVAIDTSNPAASILTKLVASPLVIAIPIAAGILVAIGLGLFISSYASGKEDN